MWIYHQRTGLISRDTEAVGTGYSGFEAGKNNPAMERIHNVGPIPAGMYRIGPPHDTATHGPHVMTLTPEASSNTFGRDGFLIHADSISHPGAASRGCIILPLAIRRQISSSGDSQMQVVSG